MSLKGTLVDIGDRVKLKKKVQVSEDDAIPRWTTGHVIGLNDDGYLVNFDDIDNPAWVEDANLAAVAPDDDVPA